MIIVPDVEIRCKIPASLQLGHCTGKLVAGNSLPFKENMNKRNSISSKKTTTTRKWIWQIICWLIFTHQFITLKM